MNQLRLTASRTSQRADANTPSPAGRVLLLAAGFALCFSACAMDGTEPLESEVESHSQAELQHAEEAAELEASSLEQNEQPGVGEDSVSSDPNPVPWHEHDKTGGVLPDQPDPWQNFGQGSQTQAR